MRPGDVVRLRTMRAYGDGSDLIHCEDWTAPKGQVFVCVVLGCEPQKPREGDTRLDPVAVLEALGWTRPTESTEAPK